MGIIILKIKMHIFIFNINLSIGYFLVNLTGSTKSYEQEYSTITI